jgi:hypothetical protein
MKTTSNIEATTSTDTTPGYWEDAQGNLVPVSKIKDIDRVRDEVVKEMCQKAKEIAKLLAEFKANTMSEVAAFVATSHEQYGLKVGGKKGNVTLTSFDGKFQVVRQIQETLAFDERLQAAKELIDACLHVWSEGANDNIKALVNHAFQVDQEGKVNTGRVLSLRSLKIDDAQWLEAMAAIADSIRTSSSKPYIRFYERDDNGKHVAITLDITGA